MKCFNHPQEDNFGQSIPSFEMISIQYHLRICLTFIYKKQSLSLSQEKSWKNFHSKQCIPLFLSSVWLSTEGKNIAVPGACCCVTYFLRYDWDMNKCLLTAIRELIMQQSNRYIKGPTWGNNGFSTIIFRSLDSSKAARCTGQRPLQHGWELLRAGVLCVAGQGTLP